MKYRNCIKWAVFLLLLLVCATLLFSCKNNESPNVDNTQNPTDTSEPDESTSSKNDETKYEPIESTDESGNDDISLEDITVDDLINVWIRNNLSVEYNNFETKYYPDEFYNISTLGFLCDTNKIDEYLNNGFWKEYNGLTPPIYMFIRHLNVGREEFSRINNVLRNYNSKYRNIYSVYDDTEIELLFSSNEFDVRKQLCKDNYVYCGGVFYDYMESDIIVFKDQARTYREWYTIFSEDMELYDDFLCYADSKAYARFKYELSKEESLLKKYQIELKNGDDYYPEYYKIYRNYNILNQRMQYYGTKLIQSSSGKGEMDRYYGDKILDNGFPVVFFRKREVKNYYDNNYLNKTSAEELNYLPTAYYLIRDLNLKDRKEEFRQENEFRMITDDNGIILNFLDLKEFEYLFGDYDEETLKKELKYPTVFYFEGKLYDLEDLQDADSALLDKMVAGTEFKDYLTDLKRMRVYKESEELYGELVDGWLEKYYGIKD
ncbi:MAG: hypothetical protein IJ292_03880 [Clostridia bacterium]|nr:hypothetical protein [Clostridia bacterium]